MSAYSSSLRKPLVRNHTALRSEYSDSIMKNTGRADNRLQEQFKELERARKVIEADLRQQKSMVAATYTPTRRSSYPSLHAKMHGKILAEKASADERLNNFLAQSLSRSRPDKLEEADDKPGDGGTRESPRGPKSSMARSYTAGARLASYHSAPEVANVTSRDTNIKDYSVSRHGTMLNEDEEDDDFQSVERQKSARKKSRESFFNNLSKPKHPVSDKKSVRAKIEEDMERTRKTQGRKSKSLPSYTY